MSKEKEREKAHVLSVFFADEAGAHEREKTHALCVVFTDEAGARERLLGNRFG